MTMQNWLDETDNFLKSNRRPVLDDKGKVSHDDAVAKAEGVYKQFRIKQDQDYISNFDIETAKYLRGDTTED